jgi:hypothetical protein
MRGLHAAKLLTWSKLPMDNVKLETKNNILTITIDLTRSSGRSKSGKTEVIATTRGNQPVPGAEGVKIGLNIYK